MRRTLLFKCLAIIILGIIAIPSTAIAQQKTVGLFLNSPGSFDGYTLFAPLNYTTAYLINNEGRLIHFWEGDYTPGNSVYLLENGHLLRTCNVGNQIFTAGGTGGRIQEVDWDGSLIWDFQFSSDRFCQHHDVEMLPNGNVLLIAWEHKTKDRAILAGRNPALVSEDGLWVDHIIEIQPNGVSGGDVVWRWHVWDHLIQEFDENRDNYGVVADHPELIDINYVQDMIHAQNPDWNHTNGIDYNEALDQIIISLREFSEFWIIDHSTTTEEAAGHTGGNSGKGGDLLYRWGNPQVYGAGSESDRRLFFQHDAQWIPSGYPGEGNILVFNNGEDRPDGNYSSVDEVILPVDEYGQYSLTPGSAFGPEEAIWSYTAKNPKAFFADHISGAHRLPNGNSLICDGPHGVFLEVTSGKEPVWRYVNPVTGQGPLMQGDPIPGGQNAQENQVFRTYRYALDYPAFDGRDLTPGDFIERYPETAVEVNQAPGEFRLSQNYPNPFNPMTTISYILPSTGKVVVKVFNLQGEEVVTLVDGDKQAGMHQVVWHGKDHSGNDVGSGMYFYRLRYRESVEIKRMLLVR